MAFEDYEKVIRIRKIYHDKIEKIVKTREGKTSNAKILDEILEEKFNGKQKKLC